MLVGQLCYTNCVTSLSVTVMGVSFLELHANWSPEDDPGFLSVLLNIMTCHHFFICGTLFNVYDPHIETDLRSVSVAMSWT
jgi:hypothetical protein